LKRTTKETNYIHPKENTKRKNCQNQRRENKNDVSGVCTSVSSDKWFVRNASMVAAISAAGNLT
jgi:hypothetical protein